MGKLMLLLYFILSVFPADATENRRHIHVVRRGSKKSQALIIETIDTHWKELNQMIDDVFAGKKIQIKRIK